MQRWDRQLSKEILAHWFDLMNVDGWIGREQILGEEARSKVPDEFVVQNDRYANPPTFFIAIEQLMDTIGTYGSPGRERADGARLTIDAIARQSQTRRR
jgi:mannosyl-oligosaccharide glucosidase